MTYQIRNRTHGIMFVVLTGGLLLPCSTQPMAFAQQQRDTIGTGQALDANLSALDGPLNSPKPTFELNRINNAIVTGNVAGGKGFRGNLGYTAATDFRGSAGSNDLFSLTAGSFQPGLMAQRSTFLQVPARTGMLNARYQMSFQPTFILSRPASGLSAGDVYVSRTAGGSMAVDPTGGLHQLMQPENMRNANMFNAGRMQRSVRDSMYGSWDQWSLQVAPSWLHEQGAAAGAGGFGGESMRAERDSRTSRPAWMTGEDSSNFRMLKRLGADRGLPDSASTRGIPADRAMRGTPAFRQEQILAQVGARTGSRGLEVGGNQFIDLQARMIAQANGIMLTDDGEYSDDIVDAILRFNSQVGKSPRRGRGAEADEEAEGGDRDTRALRLPDLEELRSLNLPVLETLASNVDSEANAIIRSAETALAEHQYFEAERLFNEALAIEPGYPLAMMGKVHAQLGAGLYRSAVWNLRILLERYPEMSAVRTGADLNPAPERLAQILNELDDMQLRNALADGGLLIAYTARLLHNEERVADGIAAMEQANPSDPLVTTLRSTWLEGANETNPPAGGEGEVAEEEPSK